MSSRPPKKGWLAHYGELLGAWTRRSESPQDVEDAAHDAIANLLDGRGAAVANTRAYLHRSVHNRLIDMRRQNQVLDKVPLHDLPEAAHPRADDPDADLRAAELAADLKTALLELPVKCRQVFLWHKLEGYTQEEIAQRLGISVNMVEKYMVRAARHLRERLQHHAPH